MTRDHAATEVIESVSIPKASIGAPYLPRCCWPLIKYREAVARRSAKSALCFFLALALLGAIVFQGRRFLWCPLMLEAREACCCPATSHDDPGPTVERPACCDARAVPQASHASSSSDHSFPALVAVAVDIPAIRTEAPYVDDGYLAPSHPSSEAALLPPRGPPYALNCAYLI